VSDLERLEWLEEVKVERYKIASDDALNEELCRTIIGKGKPILISDGYLKSDMDIPVYLDSMVNNWLYCISEYPTSLDKLNFPSYGGGFSARRAYVGFSDHTVGISAAVVAMSLGARIIEKHFTLDKAMPGPDHVCSADPEELRQLCKFRDDIERILYKDQG
jgi:N-acetylneuraminate synthase/N,N'-diacetyllegionaminate synthase